MYFLNILNIENIPKDNPGLKLNERQLEFIDACTALMIPRGMPRSVARLFSYLMLCEEPVSLDTISEDLQVAKSSVSVTTRLLETARLVRRHSQPGSKRVLYSLSDSPGAHMAEQSRHLGEMGRLLRDSTPEVATGAAAERMRGLADFYLAMGQVMDAAIAELGSATND